MNLYNLHMNKERVKRQINKLKNDKSITFFDKKQEIHALLVRLKSINLKIDRLLMRG